MIYNGQQSQVKTEILTPAALRTPITYTGPWRTIPGDKILPIWGQKPHSSFNITFPPGADHVIMQRTSSLEPAAPSPATYHQQSSRDASDNLVVTFCPESFSSFSGINVHNNSLFSFYGDEGTLAIITKTDILVTDAKNGTVTEHYDYNIPYYPYTRIEHAFTLNDNIEFDMPTLRTASTGYLGLTATSNQLASDQGCSFKLNIIRNGSPLEININFNGPLDFTTVDGNINGGIRYYGDYYSNGSITDLHPTQNEVSSGQYYVTLTAPTGQLNGVNRVFSFTRKS